MQEFREKRSRFETPDKSALSNTYPYKVPSLYTLSNRNSDDVRGRTSNAIYNQHGWNASDNYKRNKAIRSADGILPVKNRSTTKATVLRNYSRGDTENHFAPRLEGRPMNHAVHKISGLFEAEADLSSVKSSSEVEPGGKGKGKMYGTEPSNERRIIGHGSSRSPVDVFQFRRKDCQTRVLTGPVEKIMYWFKLKNHFHLLFEVVARLSEVDEGKYRTEKRLVLRDVNTGPSMLALFYETDRPLPHLNVGGFVKCIGRMISCNTLQAFKVEQCSEEEVANIQRLFFISNMVAEEAKNSLIKK